MSDMFDPTKSDRTWNDIKESCGIDDKNTIKTLANRNYGFFFEYVLGYEVSSPVTQQAIRFHQNPEDFKETSSDMGAIKAAVVAPRGHSKTVSWTIGPTLWRMWKETGKEILISSASSSQSKDILADIKRIIVRNDALKHLEPTPENIAELGENCDIKAKESNWAAESVTATSDVTVQTKTFGSSIRSKHVDYVFLDDVLQDENSGTRSTEQEKDTFYNVISPIVENKGGVLQIVGTPMSHDDLLMELIEKDNFHITEYEAYNPETEEVLWPEKWSIEGLKQKKAEIGPARFAREYMCDPMSVEEQYFSVNECLDPNLDASHYKPHTALDKYRDWDFYVGVYVALSDKGDSDYNVFTVIGEPRDREEKYIVEIVRYQSMSPEGIANTLEDLDNKYEFRKGLYEKNAQGEGLHHEMRDRPGLRTRITGFDTTRTSRPQILSRLQASLYRQELKIVDQEGLVSEMAAFRKNSRGKLEGKGHDDTVMSLAIAYECIEGGEPGEASIGVVGLNDDMSENNQDIELGETGIVGDGPVDSDSENEMNIDIV